MRPYHGRRCGNRKTATEYLPMEKMSRPVSGLGCPVCFPCHSAEVWSSSPERNPENPDSAGNGRDTRRSSAASRIFFHRPANTGKSARHPASFTKRMGQHFLDIPFRSFILATRQKYPKPDYQPIDPATCGKNTGAARGPHSCDRIFIRQDNPGNGIQYGFSAHEHATVFQTAYKECLYAAKPEKHAIHSCPVQGTR